jgi:predicted kinase
VQDVGFEIKLYVKSIRDESFAYIILALKTVKAHIIDNVVSTLPHLHPYIIIKPSSYHLTKKMSVLTSPFRQESARNKEREREREREKEFFLFNFDCQK